jgi:16S rRNA (guanine527-N7)-methyltransferase
LKSASLQSRIADVAEIINIDLPEGAAERLVQYTEELLRWNRRINLTGARTPEDFIDGPLFDALTLIPVLDNVDFLVDIGSGGGLPGIPAAIVRKPQQLTLVEPRAKRASFLRNAVHLLNLDVEVIEARDDALDARWSGAVAQAVFGPAEWPARAERLLTPGGHIYVLSAEEISVPMLPANAKIAAEFRCTRPLKKMPRFAYRVAL